MLALQSIGQDHTCSQNRRKAWLRFYEENEKENQSNCCSYSIHDQIDFYGSPHFFFKGKFTCIFILLCYRQCCPTFLSLIPCQNEISPIKTSPYLVYLSCVFLQSIEHIQRKDYNQAKTQEPCSNNEKLYIERYISSSVAKYDVEQKEDQESQFCEGYW